MSVCVFSSSIIKREMGPTQSGQLFYAFVCGFDFFRDLVSFILVFYFSFINYGEM